MILTEQSSNQDMKLGSESDAALWPERMCSVGGRGASTGVLQGEQNASQCKGKAGIIALSYSGKLWSATDSRERAHLMVCAPLLCSTWRFASTGTAKAVHALQASQHAGFLGFR